MGSILGNIPCTLERMCIMGFFFRGRGCGILKMSTKSNCSIVSFRICIAILIFFLEDLSSGVLKSPAIFPSVSPFVYLIFIFISFHSPILGTYMLMPKKLLKKCIFYLVYLSQYPVIIASTSPGKS